MRESCWPQRHATLKAVKKNSAIEQQTSFSASLKNRNAKLKAARKGFRIVFKLSIFILYAINSNKALSILELNSLDH